MGKAIPKHKEKEDFTVIASMYASSGCHKHKYSKHKNNIKQHVGFLIQQQE